MRPFLLTPADKGSARNRKSIRQKTANLFAKNPQIYSPHIEIIFAIQIIGPKWCGKTTTAKQFAESYIEMQDPDMREAYMETAKVRPSNLLVGKNPRLIDEWQIAPNIWDAVRVSVDRRNEEGLYILTGSFN